MLNEFIYCSRLAWLMWVDSEMDYNKYVIEGKNVHRNVDNKEDELELPDELPLEKTTRRSLLLSSKKEKIIARLDVLEVEDGKVFPVEYKRGKAPVGKPAWPSDLVQLCAHALILIENGYNCDQGFIYYDQNKHRQKIIFKSEDFNFVRNTVSDLLSQFKSEKMPSPLEDSPKCRGCSLVGICLPDETNLFLKNKGNPKELRRIIPSRCDRLPLYIQDHRCRVGKKGKEFHITKKRKTIQKTKIMSTSQINIYGNASVTTSALKECFKQNIPVVYFSYGGWFYGLAHGLGLKNSQLKKAQFLNFEKENKKLEWAKSIVGAKIKNYRTLLMRNTKTGADKELARMKDLLEKLEQTKTQESLLGIEGAAAKLYFSTFSTMLREKESLKSFDFNGRNRRPPLDPVNSMLSFLYAILTKDITITLFIMGFDPFAGFYHSDRFGRPALALDLMEEFRALIVDSTVITLINNKMVAPDDFLRVGENVNMKSKARKTVIKAYENRMDQLITHPLFGYRISYRRIIEVQARLFSRVLLGELDEYTGFTTR